MIMVILIIQFNSVAKTPQLASPARLPVRKRRDTPTERHQTDLISQRAHEARALMMVFLVRRTGVLASV